MVAGFWTLDLTTITGQSAFILRHHTAAVSSYDCTFDDLELVHQSLRTLEPPHTHKFPRVNAQDSCPRVRDRVKNSRYRRHALIHKKCNLDKGIVAYAARS